MNEELITIFTPTFNRAYRLKRLYESLLRQTSLNFEWLIIDDGSIDETDNIVKNFTTDLFSINYKKKRNEGKSAAINDSVKYANGEWIFIVDSDDALVDTAIERANFYIKQIRDNKFFCGIAGLKGGYNNEKISDVNYPNNKQFLDATVAEYRFKYHCKGDHAEIIRKEVLAKFVFPRFKGEKFVSESYLWLGTSNAGYKFRWFNEVIYLCEYLPDGLTQAGQKLFLDNPRGKAFVDNYNLTVKGYPFIEKIRSCINYYRYGEYAGLSFMHLYAKCNDKILSILAMPMSLVFRIKK